MSILGMIDSLNTKHTEFIEATYHLRNPRLIEERSLLLEDVGNKTNIMADPYLESPPRYGVGKRKFAELNLPTEVSDILTQFAENKLEVFNPPYDHQAEAIEAFFTDEKNVIVTTGTGSGKTEVFLYSILGHLARESKRNKTTNLRSVRSLVLYPMNALVADQLTRMRGMFGLRSAVANGKSPQDLLRPMLNDRAFRFAMYTGRTPYHGLYDSDKNDDHLQKVVQYYLNLSEEQPDLFEDLQKKGRVPEKDLSAFRGYNRRASKATGNIDPKYRTHIDDAEYFARHEVLDSNNRFDNPGGPEFSPTGGSPDLLITNYSMLEYMLLRPIEQTILDDTKQWLESDDENKLLLIMDEAHLYRGSGGAEIALLLNRLRQRLKVDNSKIKYILTSASFNEGARKFASQLTSTKEEDWYRQGADPIRYNEDESTGTTSIMNALIDTPDSPVGPDDLVGLSTELGWGEPPKGGPNQIEEAQIFLGTNLDKTPLFRYFSDELENPTSVGDLAGILFPNETLDEAKEAVLKLGNLACFARKQSRGEITPLMPTRLHLFFRGLTKQYICTNHECGFVRTSSKGYLGKMYLQPRFTCECNHRSFELESCRDCGTAYLHVYSSKTKFENFIDDSSSQSTLQIWTEPSESDSVEFHVHPLEPNANTENRVYFLDTKSGVFYRNNINKDSIIRCEIGQTYQEKHTFGSSWQGYTFDNCVGCRTPISTSSRRLKIQDLETKGQEPISNLSAVLFSHQPEKIYKNLTEADKYPNRGKKVLAFSDSRNKASSLASTLQSDIENDSFRQTIFKVIKEQFSWKNGKVRWADIYFGFLWYAAQRKIRFFSNDRDRRNFNKKSSILSDLIEEWGKDGEPLDEVLFDHISQRQEFDGWRESSYNAGLLRMAGDGFYSIYKLLLGILVIDDEEIENKIIQDLKNDISDERLTRAVLANVLMQAANERAIDPILSKAVRDDSRRFAESETKRQGLDYPQTPLLVDENLRQILIDEYSWDDDIFAKLRNSISRSYFTSMPKDPVMSRIPEGSKTGPQTASIDRLCLNPNMVSIYVETKISSWCRCNDCLEYIHPNLLLPKGESKLCPHCGGDGIVEVENDDIHANTRMGFFRNPVIQLMEDPDTHPLTIRAEEHTAQVNNRIDGEAFSKAERYELEFQDVLIDSEDSGNTDKSNDQPVDLLSCTTTMEVGIDIGSLTAVVMRTVPPRSDNYQQRAGRAGRRGSSLSTILSYANNSPHEQHIFSNPGEIIDWGSSQSPTLQIDNERICTRHLNALFIQKYFTVVAKPDPDDNSNVFESIGHIIDFFSEDNKTEHGYIEFEKWMKKELTQEQNITNFADLLPRELRKKLDPKEENPDWRLDFVKEKGEKFLTKIGQIYQEQKPISKAFFDELEKAQKAGMNPSDPKFPKKNKDDTLLNFFLRKGFLPTFSFPLDVCNFSILDTKNAATGVKETFSPSMGLRQALSAYVPGNQLYIDGNKYQSGGIYVPYPPDLENRFNHVIVDNLEHVMLCQSCNALEVYEDSSKAPKSLKGTCNNCHSPDEQKIIPMYQPSNFAPPVDRGGRQSRKLERNQDRILSLQSSVLLPVSEDFDERKLEPLVGSPVTRMLTESDRRFYQLNLGKKDEDCDEPDGWEFCGHCGTCKDVVRDNKGQHTRVYPNILTGSNRFTGQCNSSHVKKMALGYKFRTDMLLLRVSLNPDEIPPEEINSEGSVLMAAAQSLSEAIIRSITENQFLNIDSSEIDGHTRLLLNQGPKQDKSYLDFYLFDDTPGGSGHAGRVSSVIQEVLTHCEQILDCSADCERSCHRCLRTYQNRFIQGSLDRHWANSLLTYINTGKMGDINKIRSKNMVESMLVPAINASLASVRLPECGPIDFDRKSGISTITEIGPKKHDLTIHIRTKLETERNDVDFSFSDYDIMNDIESVIDRIISKLS